MSQFYITDERSARIATEGLLHRAAVSMTGTVGSGIRSFTGVVQIGRRGQNGIAETVADNDPGLRTPSARIPAAFHRAVAGPVGVDSHRVRIERKS